MKRGSTGLRSETQAGLRPAGTLFSSQGAYFAAVRALKNAGRTAPASSLATWVCTAQVPIGDSPVCSSPLRTGVPEAGMPTSCRTTATQLYQRPAWGRKPPGVTAMIGAAGVGTLHRRPLFPVRGPQYRRTRGLSGEPLLHRWKEGTGASQPGRNRSHRCRARLVACVAFCGCGRSRRSDPPERRLLRRDLSRSHHGRDPSATCPHGRRDHRLRAGRLLHRLRNAARTHSRAGHPCDRGRDPRCPETQTGPRAPRRQRSCGHRHLYETNSPQPACCTRSTLRTDSARCA